MNKQIEHSDSDYESDPIGDAACKKHPATNYMLREEPKTAVLEYNTYPVVAEQEGIQGLRKPLGRFIIIRKNIAICARTQGLR